MVLDMGIVTARKISTPDILHEWRLTFIAQLGLVSLVVNLQQCTQSPAVLSPDVSRQIDIEIPRCAGPLSDTVGWLVMPYSLRSTRILSSHSA